VHYFEAAPEYTAGDLGAPEPAGILE
jgi:hypothetical protein